MSEMKGCAEFAKYDTMPTEDLQEILRKHAHDELQVQMDMEELFYIMEVLADRRYDTPEQAAKATEEAYATFRKHYMPKQAHKKPLTTKLLRCAAVIAVVFVVLFAATTTVEAFGVNVWDKFAVWTREFFSFSDGTQGTQPTEPDKTDEIEYSELQKALNEWGIAERLAPTWLPEGYVNKDTSVMSSPRERSIHAIYENNGAELIISIRQTVGVEPEQIEKNDHLLEIYTANGVEYYIFSNTDTLQAAWVIGEFECQMIGKISLDEMKMMINSI